MNLLTRPAQSGPVPPAQPAQRWPLMVAVGAVSLGLCLLAGLTWYELLSVKQAGGTVLIIVALLAVIDATKDDAPPAPQLLPDTEQPVMMI